MKKSPVFVAFLQVIGVVIYILTFTFAINYVSGIFGDSDFGSPMIGMSFFLLAFVTSALICSSLVLGYPLYLFLNDGKRRAVMIVLWSAFWFVIVLLLATTELLLL